MTDHTPRHQVRGYGPPPTSTPRSIRNVDGVRAVAAAHHAVDRGDAREVLAALDRLEQREPYGAVWSRERGGPVIWAAVTVTALAWALDAARRRVRRPR